MKHRGAVTVFVTAFTVVLLGGLALAQVGALRPSSAPDTDEVTLVAGIAASDDRAELEGGSDAAPRQSFAIPTLGGTAIAPASSGTNVEDTSGDEPKDVVSGAIGSVDPNDGSDPAGGGPDDTTPPPIEILHPEDGQIFREKTITFEGLTEPEATVHAGRYEADVDGEGHWRIRLVLSEGRNVATFKATDAAGNSASASVTVVYEPEKVEPPRVEFTAHQKHGSSSATPPYDVFYGTATPGADIFIGSDFGRGRTEATSKGHWEVKVTFPEAPVGKAFRVVVESSDGGRKVFEFVRKGDKVDPTFTAHQTYGSCGEEIPYDVFYGSAAPGERIWVESRYGSGVTEANANGKWEIRVDFPEAPTGKEFEVVVEAARGGRKVFTFVNTGGGEH